MRVTCSFSTASAWLLTLLGSLWCPAGEPIAKATAKARAPQPKITISKETTYITSPLRPDGYPDHLAALNELTSRGVTPENNAAVPFWRAIGPKSIPTELRPQFFKLLGIEELPEKGAYLVPLYEFLQSKKGLGDGVTETPEQSAAIERIYKQQEIAQSRPWSAREFPELAEWIAANEAPLAGMCEGAKRPRFYRPLVLHDGDPFVNGCLLYDGIGGPREGVRILTARAMLCLKAGKVDDAWQDVLAVQRIGRVMAQGPLMLDEFLGCAMTFFIANGRLPLTFAHEAKLDAKQAAKCLADVQSLPPWPSTADKWDLGERCFCLAYVLEAAQVKGMPPSFRHKGKLTPEEKAVSDAMEQLASDPWIDWDEAFRSANAMVDRCCNAWRLPSYQQRRKALEEIEDDIAAVARKAVDPANLKRLATKDASPQALGKNLAAVIAHTSFDGSAALLYAPHREEVESSLMILTLALAGYRADHGDYPATLAELNPKYIDNIPKDAFTDRDLVYRAQDGGKGYVLYSLGKNGRDDGGSSYFDDLDKYENVEPDKLPDDIAIRTPAVVAGKAKE